MSHFNTRFTLSERSSRCHGAALTQRNCNGVKMRHKASERFELGSNESHVASAARGCLLTPLKKTNKNKQTNKKTCGACEQTGV